MRSGLKFGRDRAAIAQLQQPIETEARIQIGFQPLRIQSGTLSSWPVAADYDILPKKLFQQLEQAGVRRCHRFTPAPRRVGVAPLPPAGQRSKQSGAHQKSTLLRQFLYPATP